MTYDAYMAAKLPYGGSCEMVGDEDRVGDVDVEANAGAGDGDICSQG